MECFVSSRTHDDALEGRGHAPRWQKGRARERVALAALRTMRARVRRAEPAVVCVPGEGVLPLVTLDARRDAGTHIGKDLVHEGRCLGGCASCVRVVWVRRRVLCAAPRAPFTCRAMGVTSGRMGSLLSMLELYCGDTQQSLILPRIRNAHDAQGRHTTRRWRGASGDGRVGTGRGRGAFRRPAHVPEACIGSARGDPVTRLCCE